jgi:hypothetical protein
VKGGAVSLDLTGQQVNFFVITRPSKLVTFVIGDLMSSPRTDPGNYDPVWEKSWFLAKPGMTEAHFIAF